MIWFQQDGATWHTARETMDLLRSRFGEQFISCLGPVDWPPRSGDITPLDFYLWGYVKSKCFVDKPATIEALEANITEVTSEIPTGSPRASHSKLVFTDGRIKAQLRPTFEMGYLQKINVVNVSTQK